MAHRGEYDSIPLAEFQNGEAKTTKEKQGAHAYPLGNAALFATVLAAAAALAVRIDVQRRLLLVSECATRSLEVWLPFVVAVYDALRFQKRQDVRAAADDDEDMDSSAYHDFARSLKSSLLSSPWRYVPAALLLSLGCHLVAGLWTASPSTHVCPVSSSDVLVIPRLQWLALLLDSFLTISTLELAVGGVLPSTSVLSVPMSWAAVLTLAAGAWGVIAAYVNTTQPENHAWLFIEHGTARIAAISSLVCQAVFLSVFCISSLYSVSHNSIKLPLPADALLDIRLRDVAHIHGVNGSSYNDTRSALHLVSTTPSSATIHCQSYMVFCTHVLRVVPLQPYPEGYA